MGGRVMLKITITWKDNRKGHQGDGKRISRHFEDWGKGEGKL